jgi:hypothetical protein
MLAVALLVIPSILLDQPQVAEPWRSVGVLMNWVIWSAFLLELVVMVAISPNRWSYLRRNPIDLIVVVLTPPFLTSAVNGVRLRRLARVARLVRLAPLVTWMFRSGGLRYATAFASAIARTGRRVVVIGAAMHGTRTSRATTGRPAPCRCRLGRRCRSREHRRGPEPFHDQVDGERRFEDEHRYREDACRAAVYAESAENHQGLTDEDQRAAD